MADAQKWQATGLYDDVTHERFAFPCLQRPS